MTSRFAWAKKIAGMAAIATALGGATVGLGSGVAQAKPTPHPHPHIVSGLDNAFDRHFEGSHLDRFLDRFEMHRR